MKIGVCHDSRAGTRAGGHATPGRGDDRLETEADPALQGARRQYERNSIF